MSSTLPPEGGQPTFPGQQPEHHTEYLEAGGGSPIDPGGAPVASGGGRRRGLLIGGAVAALAVVGVGAWAATSFFATGAQPDEVLPAGTIGYASIDLDPSGTQKIEALRTLNKFPAFKDELGLDTDDDIRQRIFEEIQKGSDCGLDYAEDIEPWLGNRLAVAAVDTGGDTPSPVLVVQVKDADAADDGLVKLRDCGTSSPATTGGWVIDGDWAIVAEDKETAMAVAAATDQGTLADDETYQELTSAAGEAGIVSLYASPRAAEVLGEMAGGMTGLVGPMAGFDGDAETMPEAADEVTETLQDFQGLAVTVRFDDGALEIESAGDTGVNLDALYASDRGADVMETLPADTAAAIGVGFEPGWLTQLVDQVSSSMGGEMTTEELFQEASDATGLELPADAETLMGESAALSVGSEFDAEELFNSLDTSNLPVAMKVQGDPEAIQAVLAKITKGNPQEPDMEELLGHDSDGDTIVVGPSADYRAKVLERGTLGDSEVFRDVVREADRASAVFFIDFNVNDDWLAQAVGGEDPSIAENLTPLAGFGITSWKDGDLAHGVLRLTTD